MRYLIKFSYDGSNYYGYQKQKDKETIQEKIEDAIQEINNNVYTPIHASGRTDRGVHALEQYAHFDLNVSITCENLKRAINSKIPDDIHIIKAKEVSNDFHARFKVKSKEYKYYLCLGEYNPLEKDYVHQYNYILNVDKMKEAIKYFVGEHDFRAFVTENKDKENCVRTIFDASITKSGKKIVFTFKGTGFLRYQVRNMVGILIKVGQEKIKPSDVKTILESKDRSENGVIAPSCGLYLTKVNYK